MSEEQVQNAALAAEDENHIIAERRAKLLRLREKGVAYPNDFHREDLFGDLRAKYGEMTAEELEAAAPEVACSGRMMLKRVMGKASFATVRDFTGEMQYFITPADVAKKPTPTSRPGTSATSSPSRGRSFARSAANSRSARANCV